MSINTENTIDASETRGAERIVGSSNRISLEVFEERIRVDLEPLNEQILILTQLLNQLI